MLVLKPTEVQKVLNTTLGNYSGAILEHCVKAMALHICVV